ncbi:MAG: helix-turn-helix domain-containing protein [Cyanobacteriota bacterium]
MMNGRSFGEREQNLLQRFAYRRQLALTPQQLVEKWPGITRNQIAAVCQTDLSRVNRWLSRGRSYEAPSPYYSQTLALFDIFLEYYEQLPEALKSRYC